uniref:Uncharacterized protein n=1 Tax=Octopus bimaculoides TaxID=37653 RepID=A0A0L8I0F4_OCTBM
MINMAAWIKSDQHMSALIKLLKLVFESCKRFLYRTSKKLYCYRYTIPALRILKRKSNSSLSSMIIWENEIMPTDARAERRKSKPYTFCCRASGDCSCNGKNSSDQTMELRSPLIAKTMELYPHDICESPAVSKMQNSHVIRADNEFEESIVSPVTEDFFIYDELDSEFNHKFTFF